MMPINETVTIHLREALIAGEFQPTAAMDKAAGILLTELLRMAAALKAIRPS
jgi:hypothetical protein